ncbi:MAG: hypothetical protein IPN72_17390 [Saprospiraceae bacterium]|nr:hypothetical protein [Saprospiraceae bacterium]
MERAGFRDTEWFDYLKNMAGATIATLVLMKSYDLIHWTHADFRVDSISRTWRH